MDLAQTIGSGVRAVGQALGMMPAAASAEAARGVKPMLPGGLPPLEWIRLSDLEKPQGYDNEVGIAISHYLGLARDDIVGTLARMFPQSFAFMEPVSLGLVAKITDEQARVYDGDPEFALAQGDASVEDAGGTLWSDVLKAANVRPKLVELNRFTRVCRRGFLRVTGDGECVKLTIFTPEKVHIRFRSPDRRDMREALGVYLDLAPAFVNGKKIRRWEWWSADPENPQNFIVDEVHGIWPALQADGSESYANPCRDDSGRPVIPIATFADTDDDFGYWQLPDRNLMDAARNLDASWTNLLYVIRLQGFGQLLCERRPNETAQQWPPEMTIGPDRPLMAPQGWSVRFDSPSPPIPAMTEALREFLKHVAILRGLPPASVTVDASGRGQTPSGVALTIERTSLNEVRADQIDRYQRPTERALDLVRLAHNGNQKTNATRFLGCKATFLPDNPSPPVDPASQEQVRAARIKNGMTSPARELATERNLSDEAALAEAQAIKHENEELGAATGGALGRLFGLGQKSPPDAGEKPPAPMPPEMVANAEKMRAATQES